MKDLDIQFKDDLMVKYEKKILVFFDLLGFKALIENNPYNPKLINDILRTTYLTSQAKYKCEFINFSDTVIQIFEPKRDIPGIEDENPNDFANYIHLILESTHIAHLNLLKRFKISMRGSIVLGDIYYNKEANVLF